MSWVNPVIDRTDDDVRYAALLISTIETSGWDALTSAQQDEYLAGLKGCRNFTDLNRIIGNSDFLAQILGAPQTEIPTQTYDTLVSYSRWNYLDSQFLAMCNNISAVIEADGISGTVPLQWTTTEALNYVENLLLQVFNQLQLGAFEVTRCGETYTGEDGLLI